jgi:N-acetyl-gamma-glutamyl-phosphate reductase
LFRHGKSISFLKENQFASHTKIIDLGNDFRSTKDAEFEGKSSVYGLPELNKTVLKRKLHRKSWFCNSTN